MNMYFCLFFTFLPLCYGRGSINARFGDAPYDTRHFRDEIYYRKIFVEVYPATLTVQHGQPVSIICRAWGLPNLTVTWYFTPDRKPLPPGVLDFGGRLTVASAQSYHNGSYVCAAAAGSREKLALSQIIVSFREDAARCGPEEATCNNGECVRRSSICDGEYDCRDRSDEINCGPQKQCEPNEFVCTNRRCVQKMWVCDNEDDCGDNSDEMNCATRAPGELCSPSEYKCSRNDQCIPKSYQCDGQNDCQDGSDEFGCSDPVVTQPLEPEKSACLGETLVLNCRAVGVPTPHITWRLNWGPVCDPPRCTQTSVDGYGVLTITSIQESDQGAYSCEAINTRKRILAVPDTIVTVRRCNDTNAEQTSICNRDGTIRDLPDGRCQCKPYVTGPHCDQCADFCFNLYHRNPHGCIRCFCMGVTRQCDSSGYYRSQERLSFRGDSQGVTVCSADERQTDPHVRFDYDVVPNAITIRPPRLTGVVYWSLPKSFLGNKLTSYGGKLKFAVQYSGYESPVQEPLVILRGNEITLVHRNRLSLVPDKLNPIEVDIYETSFTREDGQQATHEHLLMTLANLESLLIRETHSQSQTSSSLGDISLDVAVQSYTSQNRADAVEKCACPEGYVGLSCEECAPGYQRSGGGLYLGTCSPDDNGYQDVTTTTRRPIHHAQCDPSGSLSDRPDPRTGACHCKEHVTGIRCDQCKPQSYSLSKENPHGCITCFCSGVTRDCHSSNLYRQAHPISDFRGWVVPVRTAEGENYVRLPTPATASSDDGYLQFDAFGEFTNGKALYFEMPESVTGNKMASYGGNLHIKFTYSADGHYEDQNPCVVIRGNDITLFHTTTQPTYADRENVIRIPMFENYWHRDDKKASTREHFLMTLADLDTLLIKVTWKDNMQKFTLNDITLDHASHVPSYLGYATAVEECRCPPGYLGSSCEDCATGYTRTGGGLYLGLCEPCFCHGHSQECDPSYGECKNCQHNTVGARCDSCAPGYYGDARRGTPHDCQPESGQRTQPEIGDGNTEEERRNQQFGGDDEHRSAQESQQETEEPTAKAVYQGFTEQEVTTMEAIMESTVDHDDNEAERGDKPDALSTLKHDNGDDDQTEQTEITEGETTTQVVTCDCKCNNHSPKGCDDQCHCVECEDNTTGDHCETCVKGFYGDAAAGSPFDCRECPCPRADGCFLDADNEVVCTGCPEGHTGKHCDECQDGFKKDSENICKKEENTDVENSVQLRKLRKLRKLLRRSLKN